MLSHTVQWGEQERAAAFLSREFAGSPGSLALELSEGAAPVELARPRGLYSPAALRLVDADYQAMQRRGGWIITPGSEEFPRSVMARFQARAARGRAAAEGAGGGSGSPRPGRDDPRNGLPVALWGCGAPLDVLVDRAVAVVGSRAVSRYGVEATRMVVRELAAHGWTIVSGGAFGVDAVAHQAALEVGGRTIAVVAGGLDKPYPARHARLFDQIAQSGAVVSEYCPGTPPARHRFLFRNRLIAAFSRGVVVVEAGYRSGALSTLRWAQGMGVSTMAVPGPITSNHSLGCHRAIRENGAILVSSGDQVRAELEQLGVVDVEAQEQALFPLDAIRRLSVTELQVFDAVPQPQADPARAEDIVQALHQVPAAMAIDVLFELSDRGLVECVEGRWRKLRT